MGTLSAAMTAWMIAEDVKPAESAAIVTLIESPNLSVRGEGSLTGI